jgi:hypothetical protein
VLDPQAFPAFDTVNVPLEVKVCILKSPEVVMVPPDAVTYADAFKSPTLDSTLKSHPLVLST